jgi:hypothetical protein
MQLSDSITEDSHHGACNIHRGARNFAIQDSMYIGAGQGLLSGDQKNCQRVVLRSRVDEIRIRK